jgi:hypothetical protein
MFCEYKNCRFYIYKTLAIYDGVHSHAHVTLLSFSKIENGKMGKLKKIKRRRMLASQWMRKLKINMFSDGR